MKNVNKYVNNCDGFRWREKSAVIVEKFLKLKEVLKIAELCLSLRKNN